MNKSIFGLLILLSVGCEKKEYEAVDAPYDNRYAEYFQNEFYQYSLIKSGGIVTAIKNIPEKGNLEWKASSFAIIMPENAYPTAKTKRELLFYIGTVDHKSMNFVRDNLGFQYIPIKERRNTIKTSPNFPTELRWPSGSYARMADDGDVGARFYLFSEYNESHFTINKIDSINKKIYFSFDVYCDHDNGQTQKHLCSTYPSYCWSKNINFLGGRGVVDFPK